jgi:hypothetical protein
MGARVWSWTHATDKRLRIGTRLRSPTKPSDGAAVLERALDAMEATLGRRAAACLKG